MAYSLTEGREVINPRPRDEAAIFHAFADQTIGFITYSEGCNDDVNKFVWSALGWDPQADVLDVLRDFGRCLVGLHGREADDFAHGLFALEQNWRGPLLSNSSVETTLQQFRALERRVSPHVLANWRFQQALYRAYYDAYVRSRLIYETDLEERALDRLRAGPHDGLTRGHRSSPGHSRPGRHTARSPPTCVRGCSSWPRHCFRAFACN